MFKHWKEAEKRAAELKTGIEGLTSDIAAIEAEARNEETAVERREALIADLQGKVEKRNGLQGEYDAAITAMNNLKAAEERQFGFLNNVSTASVAGRVEARAETDKSVYETRAYEMAWAEYIKNGNDTEVRALITTQNSESAGILVPTTLANKIEDTLKTGGRILALCSIVSVKGITRYPIANSTTDPAWHDETGTDKKVEKEVAFFEVSMEPQFIAETLATTRKFEADSILAFWDWLNAELPDALKRVIDREILFGAQSGKNGIRGILTNTDSRFVETLANYGLDFNVANVAASLLADGAEQNITIVMNKKTFLQDVMGMRGADGHPIFQMLTSNTGKPSYFVNGYPVVFYDGLPAYSAAATDEVYMLLGNFNAMRLNFPSGVNVRLLRDEISRKKENIIEYLSEIYVGGNITKLGSFVKVTK